LPSAALGKAFAECLAGFAECPQHSAKRASAVVRGTTEALHTTPYIYHLAHILKMVTRCAE